MHLEEHYNNMYQQAIGQIREGKIVIDPYIDAINDSRRGLSLLIRPSDEVKEKIHLFQQRLGHIDDSPYYQPLADMHITVLSIISVTDDFDLSQIYIPDYIQLIQESSQGISEMNLHFRGITASPEAIIIQGYPLNDSLEALRNQLRSNFKNSSLRQSMDVRYTLSTAHITTARFRKQLQNPEEYAALLAQYRDVDFGSCRPQTIELVYNDWYQKAHIVKTLFTASL